MLQTTIKNHLTKVMILLVGSFSFAACNNPKSESATTNMNDSATANAGEVDMSHSAMSPADSASGYSNTGTQTADPSTVTFLQKAADGGLTEVAAGQMAENRASDADVKRFATMMVQDHTGANAQVKNLAAQRNVTLPSEPSIEHKKKMDDVAKKEGKAFDKAYMDMMVEDHQKTISLFKESLNRSSDSQVKDFITGTLPKLQTHLDAALALRKKLAP